MLPVMTQIPALTVVATVIALLSLTACYVYGAPPKATVPVDFPVYPASAPISEVYGPTAPLPDGSRDRRERYDITWNSDDDGSKLREAYFEMYPGGYAELIWHRAWLAHCVQPHQQPNLGRDNLPRGPQDPRDHGRQLPVRSRLLAGQF